MTVKYLNNDKKLIIRKASAQRLIAIFLFITYSTATNVAVSALIDLTIILIKHLQLKK